MHGLSQTQREVIENRFSNNIAEAPTSKAEYYAIIERIKEQLGAVKKGDS